MFNIIPYHLLATTKETHFSSEKPEHFYQLASILFHHLKFLNRTPRGVDMTSHIGGFSLPWAILYPMHSLVSIEIATESYEALVKNVTLLKLMQQIQPWNGDSIEYLANLPPHPEGKLYFDFVYMDPPFGGIDYKAKPHLELDFSGKKIYEHISLMMKHSEIGMIKLPFNHDLENIRKETEKNGFRLNLYRIEWEISQKVDCEARPSYLIAVISRSSSSHASPSPPVE